MPNCARRRNRESCCAIHGLMSELGSDVLIGSADPQRVHAVFEYPAADSQQVGGMGLDVVRSFEGIQDNFSLEFHHGFFER